MTNPQAESSDDLDSFFVSAEEVEKPQERSFLEGVDRRASRYIQRGAESILGLPGDVVQLVRGLAQKLPGGIEPEENFNFVQRGGRRLLESLPGSAELRARSSEVRPGLEPESEFEDVEDEVVSDFAALALPVKGKIPFARALGLSMAGNMGKQVVKELGFSEGTQEATKMGLMLFSGMFGKGRGINNHIKNLYKKANNYVPEGAKFKYPTSKLNNFERMLKKGTMDESKLASMNILEDIKAKSPNGIMKVEEAIQFDKDINRAIGKSFNDKAKRGYLKQLKSAHSEALDTYAKENPTWGESWKEAKQAYQGIATSQDIQNFVKRNANLKNISHSAILLGLEEAAIPGHALEKLGALGLTASTMYAGEVAKRIAKNPALRRYYANVINASLSENKAMLTRNLAGLERVAKKEFEKNPLPIFDIEEDEIIDSE